MFSIDCHRISVVNEIVRWEIFTAFSASLRSWNVFKIIHKVPEMTSLKYWALKRLKPHSIE